MKKSYLTALGIVLLIILWVLSGVLFQTEEAPGNEAADKALSADGSSRDIMTVSVHSLAPLPYTRKIIVRGHTEAIRQVTLKSQTKGRVEALPAAEGTRVKKGDAVCRLSIDDRQANYEEAKALKKQRELEYNAARQLAEKGFRAETRTAEAKALLEAAIARVTRSRLELDYTTIRAPFDGIVNEHFVEVGTYLQEGDSCALIMEENPFLVVGEVAEREISSLRVGGPAQARLSSGRILQGKIRYISAIADPNTRTFRVELEVENPDKVLRDGITAELIIPTEQTEAFHISSANLVLDGAGRVGVRTVGDDNIVDFVPVEIIGSDDNGIWITGPTEGAALVVVGQDFVKEGQEVKTAPYEGALP